MVHCCHTPAVFVHVCFVCYIIRSLCMDFFIFYFLLLVELTEEMGLHYEKSLFCFYFV